MLQTKRYDPRRDDPSGLIEFRKKGGPRTSVQKNRGSFQREPSPRPVTRIRIQDSELDAVSKLRGWRESKLSRAWDLISDYRNTLIISILFIFLLLIMGVAYWLKTPISSPFVTPSGGLPQLLPLEATTPGNSLEDILNSVSPSLKTIPTVTTWQQIYILLESSEAIRIKSLRGSHIGQHQPNENVRTLVVDGLITEDGLFQLLAHFPALTKLVLNMEQLCQASQVSAHSAPLDLTNIETLRFVNCYECPIMDWVLKSKTGRLHHFELCASEINKRIQELIDAFVRKSSGARIREMPPNKLCQECEFAADILEHTEEIDDSKGDNANRCYT